MRRVSLNNFITSFSNEIILDQINPLKILNVLEQPLTTVECRTIEELSRPRIDSYGGPIKPSDSSSVDFKLIHHMKSVQFRQVEEFESGNLFHGHIQGEDENAEDVQMADHLRPMEELLRIPILGIKDAIVVLAVLADQFELKPELLDFISKNSFFGLENDDPHSHIKIFYQITRTFKINQVPHDVVKLILFPFSLKGAAETWLENEPPNSITSWDDLVSKFLN
ncbi:hypothetical protein Tco_1176988 [Tanacetum coccineum]